MDKSVGEMVRQAETDYISGSTQISKYVNFSMHDTLERVDAYLNSKHISGETDSLGRDKPFANIVVAASNIWFRATDIDRKNIKIRATKSKDWIDSFAATILVQDWMRREAFGQTLNEWGRILSRYGSAVLKFVENDSGLHISVIPWNMLIVDPVDFYSNIKIEVLELTEAQLRRRIKTHGYSKEAVDGLCSALADRTTLDKQTKDNKSNYIKLYEVHGDMEKSKLTNVESDDDIYVQQMHVMSYVGKKTGRKTEYQDFTLFAGEESKDPYMITHLIKEDGRTLAMGAVEHLFQSQWMTNHAMKAQKDTLDISSLLMLQTSDPQFLGMNVLENMETGMVLVHDPAATGGITKVDNAKPDLIGFSNFAVSWKQLGNEIAGISEAMLGITPPSGTPAAQTAQILKENYSLFELMVENKGLYIEEMFRAWILPHIKKQLKHKKEISAVLESHDIERIDSTYFKNMAIKRVNEHLKEKVLNGVALQAGEKEMLMAQEAQQMQGSFSQLGNQRFFKPSDLDDKDWAEQLGDLEWELEVDVSGESTDVQAGLTALYGAIKLMMTPGFDQNKKAQAAVGKIMELSGTMSPLEYASIPSPIQPTQTTVAPSKSAGGDVQLPVQ